LTLASGTLGVAGSLGGKAFTGATTVSVNSTSDALRVTQTGTGNAFVVEDSASPDATPFVIDTEGRVIVGHTGSLSIAGRTSSFQTYATNAYLAARYNAASGAGVSVNTARSRSATPGTNAVVLANDEISRINFSGDDGSTFLDAAAIIASVDGTPGTNDMPGRLQFLTTADGAATPTERMRITNAGNVGIGSTGSAAVNLLLDRPISGSTTSYGIRQIHTVQSDVTTTVFAHQTFVNTAASAFSLTNLRHYQAAQGTIGAGSTVTNQDGFRADQLTGAANNYGFFGNIAAGVSRTITNVALTSNVVTVTTSVAHGYLAGQSVTVAATTNTAINGTYTIASVPTTTTLTYARTSADIASTADTGTTVIVGRYNFYANGTAPNYFAGNVGIGVTVPAEKVEVAGNIHVSGGDRTIFNRSNNALSFGTNNTERMRINNAGNVGIGTSSPAYLLDTFNSSTNVDYIGGRFISSEAVSGESRTWLKVEKGLNFGGAIGGYISQGVGSGLILGTQDGTATPVERLRITSAGNVGIGTSSPTQPLDVNGNVAITGTARRITGDFSNATIASRTLFQTSASNSQTGVVLIPTGTSDQAIFEANSDSTGGANGSISQIGVYAAGDVRFTSGNRGTGTLRPMTFYTGGSERMRIDASGNVGIGTTSPAQRLDIGGGNFSCGESMFTGTGVSTGDVSIEVGGNRTGSGNVYIDLHATSGTDFEARVLRASGANGALLIENTGTGSLNILQNNPGAILFSTTAAERMRVTADGNVGIGTTSPGSKLDVSGEIRDQSGNVRSVPQNAKTSAYTLIASDNGKHISITTGGVTVPSGVFAAGDTVTIYNDSASNQTITQGASVTMYLVGTATTGNRTLAQRGLCTVLCVASNTFVVTGGGLT
jgi:hypothetical protein